MIHLIDTRPNANYNHYIITQTEWLSTDSVEFTQPLLKNISVHTQLID